MSDVKLLGDDLKIKIMSISDMPLDERIRNIKKMENIVNILSHPARRLTYDSFGYT
jgi:hypothetical protein